MEHEFPGKQDYRRFRFNQNVWFEFSATSSSEWNSIFQNFQKRGKPRELYYSRYRITIRGILFSRKFSFHSTLLLEFFGWVVPISEIQHFWKLFREISVPFDAVSKFSKVLVEWKAPSKALCFISAARYCFRNIDLARQVPHKFDVQPRIMSNVPVCLLICHENKATLFTRKLEQQYVLTSEMKNFIAPWQIMAR